MQCIIYKLVKWPQFRTLIENEALQGLLQDQSNSTYVEADELFDESKNCDYSHRHNGILKETFVQKFQPYLRVCCEAEGVDVGLGWNWYGGLAGPC